MLTLGVIAGLSTRSETPAEASTPRIATETPRRNLPRVLDGIARDSARVGDFIVVGGEFTQVQLPNGTVRAVSGAYAYHINTGQFINAFTPDLDFNNGDPAVFAVEPAGPNTVLLGGRFSSVDGHAHRGLTRINISTGAVQTNFEANVVGQVRDIVLENRRLFIGGDFELVNGALRTNLAELNPATGAVTGFRNDVTDSSREAGTAFGPRYLGITPDNVLVVAHRGETVGGQDRPGLALIDLNTNRVLGWRTDFYEDIAIHTLDAEVSPDGSYVVLGGNGGDFPFLGRDSAVAFDIDRVNRANNEPRWIARNFDSTYAVGISEDAVYLGGHFCWVEAPGSPEPWPGDGEFTNNNSCFGNASAERFAPQTVNRDQLAAFDPETGKALPWDPGSDGFEGVWSIEVIDRGLLVGHDGSFLGRDGNDRRAWNVGRHGFFDRTFTDGLNTTLTTNVPADGLCNGRTPTMTGTEGNDVLIGTDGNDVIIGGAGHDQIFGMGGSDTICGGSGADLIDGGLGRDFLFGNAGRDELNGGNGNDEIEGGNGRDTARGGAGEDMLLGGRGVDTLLGNAGNDVLGGNDGRDRLSGGAGNDRVFGNSGNDILFGGIGNDVLTGGGEIDTCSGRTSATPDEPGDVIRTCER